MSDGINNAFAADDAYDAHVKADMPHLAEDEGGVFAQLDGEMSLFILLPRKEDENSFYLPAFKHYNLSVVGDDNTKRKTAVTCLKAARLGPCAICDAHDRLAASDAKNKAFAKKNLRPRKQVCLPVWWVPLTAILGTKSTAQYSFRLVDFKSHPRTYEVSDTPSVKILGVSASLREGSNTVWDNLKSMLITSGGPGNFVGVDGTPIFIIGNNKKKLDRRYKESRPLLVDFPKELRPPADIELPDVLEAMEYPTPLYVAQVLEETYPGLITDMQPYMEATTKPTEEVTPAKKTPTGENNPFI